MSSPQEIAARINNLVALLDEVNIHITLECAQNIDIRDIGVKVAFRGVTGRVFDMPTDFQAVALAQGATYTITLPMKVT